MAKRVSLGIPELGFIAVTRGALGAGVALLLADKGSRRQRKRIGWVLLAIGAATTVPLIVDVIRRSRDIDEIAA